MMRSLENEINIPRVHVYDDSKELIDLDYFISDFIEATSFRNHVRDNGFSLEHAKTIGKTLSIVHSKSYDLPHLFDSKNTEVKTISQQYKDYLTSYAGKHINKEYCDYLESIMEKNVLELKEINESAVRNHGDLNPGNILVDTNNVLWFIDFEYAGSNTPYLDFGKFLRKRVGYSHALSDEILNTIVSNYQHKLHDNWIHLSMLTDITSLLRLINKESTNDFWVTYIQKRIKDLYLDKDKVSYTFDSDEY